MLSPERKSRPNPVQTRRWRRLRRLILARDGHLCQACKAKGWITEAAHVDHIVPRFKGGDPWDHANLQALCEPCHQAKSDIEAGGSVGVCRHGTPRDAVCPDCEPPRR